MWQHCDCLGIPGDALPEAWLCEQCRLARADPFWRRVAPPPMPAQKLAPTHPHRAFGDGLKYTEDVQQARLPPGRHPVLGQCQAPPSLRAHEHFTVMVLSSSGVLLLSLILDPMNPTITLKTEPLVAWVWPQTADRHFSLSHVQLDPVRRTAHTNQLQASAQPLLLRVSPSTL